MIGECRGKHRLYERATVKRTGGVCLCRPGEAPDMYLLQASGGLPSLGPYREHTKHCKPLLRHVCTLEHHVSPEGEMRGVIKNVFTRDHWLKKLIED